MVFANAFEDSVAAMRIAFPLSRSIKVAAILPQSRNFRALFPSRHPVTTIMASVAQRSISTKVTMRLRSLPCGSRMPSFLRPSIAMRTPNTCPAQRCPWATAASSRYSDKLFNVLPCPVHISTSPGLQLRAPIMDGEADLTPSSGFECDPCRISFPGGSRAGMAVQFFSKDWGAASKLEDHHVAQVSIFCCPAVCGIVLEPARLRTMGFKLGQFQFGNVARPAVDADPSIQLPNPLWVLGRLIRQGVIKADHPAGHGQGLCDLVGLPNGIFLDPAINHKRPDLSLLS